MLFESYTTVLIICIFLTNASVGGRIKIRDKRSPQGPPFMARGPAPPPQYGRNSFDNRGPPFGRGPPFEQQPPAPRSPPGQDPYWIPPGHRNRPSYENSQNGYNFQEAQPKSNIDHNEYSPSSTKKNDLHQNYNKSTSKAEEQTTKTSINTDTESNSNAISEKDDIKITYDAGRAVAVVSGHSKPGAKVIPVTLIFQAQPVTPAS